MGVNLDRRHRRAITRVSALAATFAILVAVAFSPLALRGISSFPNLDWGKLSNVGQTYGAVSAFLAGLALIGVAVSVLLQLRETRFNRLEAGRTRHHELIRLAMDNPSYFDLFASPAFSPNATVDIRRSIAYINLYLQFQQMLWEFSDISETDIRSTARSLFSTSVGRDYWQQYGQIRLQNDNTKREREFDQTIDLVYKQAIASGPPEKIAPNLEPIVLTEQTSGRKTLAVSLVTTFVTGVILGWFTHVAWKRTASDRLNREVRRYGPSSPKS